VPDTIKRRSRRSRVVLYHCYEFGHAALHPARMALSSYQLLLNPFNPLSYTAAGRNVIAACEVFERATRRYPRPGFAIKGTKIKDRFIQVHERMVWHSAFCRLLHFKRDVASLHAEPPILLIAPMSGHFAALLRGTVKAFLPYRDVYITDWEDAREVPLSEGHFDLDDYIDTISKIFRLFEGNLHVFAVCQPAVAVLAATALMDAFAEAAVPRSITLAGGPVDTRISPTAVNRLAKERGLDWFSRSVIAQVPWPAPGQGRRVYPGFLQLSGFMMMNLNRHLQAHREMFGHLVSGDRDSAQQHRSFYDVYLAVMDLTAEFYLQTLDSVFLRHLLPHGTMISRKRRVRLADISRPSIMTIEGTKDDITGAGQCRAALDLCTGVPVSRKLHYECPGVGHYGIFSGTRFRTEIMPRIVAFMRAHDTQPHQRHASRTSRGHRLRNRQRILIPPSCSRDCPSRALSQASLLRAQRSYRCRPSRGGPT
jgi:poly(3-hydroxybutyrate) depolymerase